MAYIVLLDVRAITDINTAIEYFEKQQTGLGNTFADCVEMGLEYLQKISHFQVRYKQVRCLQVKPFPFMMQYTIDESNMEIYIHAILHTSLNPNTNWI